MDRGNRQPQSDRCTQGSRLIVHADDFGLSEKVNEGIMLAHSKGILTSASIMAVGEAFEQAVKGCQWMPTLDVGIHLTLIEEKPILPAEAIPSLVNRDGKFHRHAKDFVKLYLMGKIDLGEVRQEIDAQMRRVVDSGIPISHVDSHQHVHMLPRVFSVMLVLAKEYNISAVRIPYEKLRWKMLINAPSVMRIAQLMILNVFCKMVTKIQKVPLRADHFSGFLFGGNLNKRNLRLVLDNVPNSGSCELMCHPGLNDPQNTHGHWDYHWKAELEALVDGNLRNLLEQRGIALISYRDLYAGGRSDYQKRLPQTSRFDEYKGLWKT